jgi:hypothetical protein
MDILKKKLGFTSEGSSWVILAELNSMLLNALTEHLQ